MTATLGAAGTHDSTEVAVPSLASPDFRRWTVFVHQDGVLLCPTVRALAALGILEPSLCGELSVDDLCADVSPSGFANLRVGLRCLASQGWLADGPTLDPSTTVVRWTDSGRAAARYHDRYVAAGELLALFSSNERDTWSRPWNAKQIAGFLELLPLALDRWRLGDELSTRQRGLITTHLDAALATPAMLWLRGAGALGDDGPDLPAGSAGAGIGNLLTALGWTSGEGARWTDVGREVARLAIHFGMAASYLPLLACLPDLYRGTRRVAPESGAAEWHVERSLNVRASAAAHTRYFEDADRIFFDLFNREPVEAQPRFIADMGCGDGSWLVHLYELISEQTLRGRQLEAAPLLMVGLDFNSAALDQAQRVVDASGVPSLLLLGDVSDPDGVSAALVEHGLVMDDGLHIRAFIDHDRAYLGADPEIRVRGSSTGAYIDRQGRPLGADEVERDLVEHLRRWTPHVGKHGLVVLEAHCVAPSIARNLLGATHSVAFDAYHGYSHQYPLEHSAFLHCCREAGLRPAADCERRYPANRPFVAVSLNRLLTPESPAAVPTPGHGIDRPDGWRPEPDADLEDGRALHELLYVDGDLRYPRLWCSAATGFVVAGALETIEARLAGARRGEVIRVLDYGAGTGLATIELLKSWRERGLESRLERRGVRLELHLVDLPSSWFAQGFALLRDCPLVQFHSLQAEGGGFRLLPELIGGHRVDVVMANMVFHLIPSPALERATVELARVTADGGRLLWSAPDLGPPGRYAVLFHDANRALRRRWLELLESDPPADPQARPLLAKALGQVREQLDAAALGEAQARADRRILSRPNSAHEVATRLAERFGGEATLDTPTYEILTRDVLDTLLVPSNQREYLSEIADQTLREKVIAELMLEDVLPAMQRQPAGTAEGLNVQWTLGRVTRQELE